VFPHITLNPGAGPPLVIHMFALCIAAGLIAAFLGLDHATRADTARNKPLVDKLFILTAIALVLGVAAGYRITAWLKTGDPAVMFTFQEREGGFSFAPGLLAGALILIGLFKWRGVPVLWGLDHLAPFAALAHVFGRLGCFLGGCCHGLPTDSPLGVVFPQGSPAALEFGHGVAVHATQLYEAGLLLALFVALLWLVPFGYRLAAYLAGYGALRFCVEFLRGDDRGTIPGLEGLLSPSQLLGLVMIAAGGLLFVARAAGWVGEPVLPPRAAPPEEPRQA